MGAGTVHETTWPNRLAERVARASLWLGGRPDTGVEPPWASPSGVVSVGTAAAAAALGAAARLQVPAVAMMSPYGVPRRRWRGILLPPHDSPGQAGPAICRVLVAPSTLSWQPGPRAGVAVVAGGGRHGRGWAWERASAAVAALARSLPGTPLTVAVSRRTPAPFAAAMRAAGHTVAEPGGAPSLPEVLARAAGVVVTDDSFSMVGEAVQAGFCPLVWRLGGAGRLGLGMEELAARGWIRWENPGGRPDLLADSPSPKHGEVQEHIAAVAATLAGWLG